VASALIIGSEGQDGRLLAGQLKEKGVAVTGVDRQTPRTVDLSSAAEIATLVSHVRPDTLYYLAAHHHSAEQDAGDTVSLYAASHRIHVTGLLHVLEAMRAHAPSAHLLYAASSHVFGEPDERVQSELTPRRPLNIYAITKATGMDLCRHYRVTHGLKASCAILYNHESHLRPPGFLSMRVVLGARAAAAAVKEGKPYSLELGSLSATVDWGWAPDYTDAMQRICGLPKADDYVIATGVPHTVADFCREAFAAVGLDYTRHVTERPDRLKKSGAVLIGDASKLRRDTGWAPSLTFEQMVAKLVA
jgi:GDPmannose 4,6-dehydratase